MQRARGVGLAGVFVQVADRHGQSTGWSGLSHRVRAQRTGRLVAGTRTPIVLHSESCRRSLQSVASD